MWSFQWKSRRIYLSVTESRGQQEEHSHTSQHLGTKKRKRKWGLVKKQRTQEFNISVRFYKGEKTSTLNDPRYRFFKSCSARKSARTRGAGLDARRDGVEQEVRDFQEIWGALRNSCQSGSFSSSSLSAVANENVWSPRRTFTEGEETGKLCGG